MDEKVTHVKEVHHASFIDDSTRHQAGAERDIVEVGDSCRMGKFLLVEIHHFERCAQSHVRKLLSVDIRLNRSQVFVWFYERRVRLSRKIVGHVIVGTGNSKCSCR